MRRAAIVALIAAVAAACSTTPPYPELRQRSSQPIPGTLSATLEPPGDTSPSLAPDEAVERAPLPNGTAVEVTLARVHDGLQGTDIGPAWVAIARGVCIREDKGELVSDARGNDPNNLECTRSTFLLVALDPATGDTLLTLQGFDPTLAWAPDVERTSA